MDTVGSRVRREREAKGISRIALAKMTGIGYSTIAELERGGMQTSTKLRLIADALDVSLTYLETGKAPKESTPVASQSTGQLRDIVRVGVRAVSIIKEGGFLEVTDDNYADVLAKAMVKAQALGLGVAVSEIQMVKLARMVADEIG